MKLWRITYVKPSALGPAGTQDTLSLTVTASNETAAFMLARNATDHHGYEIVGDGWDFAEIEEIAAEPAQS